MKAMSAERESMLSGHVAAIQAVVRGREPWRSPADVAEDLGRSEAEATDILAELDAAGWIQVWERAEGPAVTLTPWAAEWLGLHLVELVEGRPRWAPIADQSPPIRTGRFAVRMQFAQPEDLGQVEDLAPGPELAAERAEGGGSPAILLGTAAAWHRPAGGPCPVCGGGGFANCETGGQDFAKREMAQNEYCLYCDRWGKDAPARPKRPRRRRFRLRHAASA